MKSFFIRLRFAVAAVMMLAAAMGIVSSNLMAETAGAMAGPNPDSLAAAVQKGLESLPYDLELGYLYMERLLAEGEAWLTTPQGQRISAALLRLGTEAMSVTTVDPKNPEGASILNYTGVDGKIMRFPSVVTRDVESDPVVRADIGKIVARSIMDRATEDGLFLYDVKSPERDAFEKGVAAAKQGDYAGALVHFREALVIAPYASDIYYNLGLVESMMPGRELRAISWFGAYLARNPKAVNAPAVRARMTSLETKSEEMIRGLLQLAEDTAKEFTMAYHHDNALYRTAGSWAQFGDTAAVERIAGLISDPDQKSYTLRLLVGLRLTQGDISAAEAAAEDIQDLFTKCKARVEIAEAQFKMGDQEGARKSLTWTTENIKLVSDAYYRSIVLTSIAEIQIKLGDLDRAKETLEDSKKNIALYSLCYSVVYAQCHIAEAEMHMGDVAAAEETFAAAQKNADILRDNTSYGYIAEARARTGDIAAAFKAAEQIEDVRGWTQDFTRLTIIEAQIKAGDIAGAKATAEKTTDSFRKKAERLLETAKGKQGVASWDWVGNLIDEGSLAGETFMDVTAYMKRLWIPDSPSDDFEVVLNRSSTYLEGHQLVSQMVKNLTEFLSQ